MLSSLDDPLRLELAEMLGDRWADALMIEEQHRMDDLWARDQIELWLERRFGILDGKPSMFVYLSETFGADVLRTYITEWYSQGDAYLALQQVADAEMPPNPSNHDFEHFLNLVVALNNSSDGLRFINDYRTGDDLFFEVDDISNSPPFFHQWMYGAEPSSFQVEKTEQFGDVLWLTVFYRSEISWWMGDDGSRLVPASALIPFRKVDSSWKLALLKPEDWGEAIVEQGELVTFTYHAIDTEYYADLLPSLEDAYVRTGSLRGAPLGRLVPAYHAGASGSGVPDRGPPAGARRGKKRITLST